MSDKEDDLRCAIVPIFFGLGVVWHREAPYADAVEAVVGPWDRNPILARLEGNRTLHLARQHVARTYLHMEEAKVARHEEFLNRLSDSDVYALASKLLELRTRGEGPSMVERLEAAIGKDDPSPGVGDRIEM